MLGLQMGKNQNPYATRCPPRRWQYSGILGSLPVRNSSSSRRFPSGRQIPLRAWSNAQGRIIDLNENIELPLAVAEDLNLGNEDGLLGGECHAEQGHHQYQPTHFPTTEPLPLGSGSYKPDGTRSTLIPENRTDNSTKILLSRWWNATLGNLPQKKSIGTSICQTILKSAESIL